MIKNYLQIGIRNLRKQLPYTVINIFGLGLGLAVCLLLTGWIRHELSYDRFHDKSDRIYRSSMEMSFGGRTRAVAVSPTALLPALKEFPEVQEGVRIYDATQFNPIIVKKDDKIFQERNFYFADSTFFKVFSYRLLKGDPATALSQPNTIILTETAARKYFGDEDPIGKTLTINSHTAYSVTGVMQDIPSNSYLQFDFLAAFSSLSQAKEVIWWSANYHTFIVVDANTDITQLAEKTNTIVKKALAAELTSPNDYVRFNFMKLTDIHLHSHFDSEMEVVSDIRYVYIFSAVAALILLIACINYINLATARATNRAKEVGIRKVAGAARLQLFFQFMGESAVIILFTFVLAFVAAQLLLPVFNTITGLRLTSQIFYDGPATSFSLILLVFITLLSGAYPALAMTAFKPVSILKGNYKSSDKGIWLRKILVITQFCISIILMAGTLVIMKQLNFIQNKKLGYDKENILILPLDWKMLEVYESLSLEFLRSGKVTSVGRATESPTKILGGYGFKLDQDQEGHGLAITAIAADTGLVNTLGIDLLAGRNFTDGDFQRAKADTSRSSYSFIVNEAALKALFLTPQQALGTRATLSGRKGKIIGIVKNFHFASLHQNISPLVIFSEEDYSFMFVKVAPGNTSKSIGILKNIYNKIVQHRPFEYEFLDLQYEALYLSEQRMGVIFIVFASLAIIIACLGLLGLVSFSAAQRTKEIGIRKVLGATASNIVFLITSDFTKLILISIVIGIPLSYWLMVQWLSDFAYKTDIGVGPLLIACLTCFSVAVASSGVQAIKTALLNPARTLRDE